MRASPAADRRSGLPDQQTSLPRWFPHCCSSPAYLPNACRRSENSVARYSRALEQLDLVDRACGPEKAARFAIAEGIRWLESGTRSYENFTLGLAVLLFAIAMVRTTRVPRPIAASWAGEVANVAMM